MLKRLSLVIAAAGFGAFLLGLAAVEWTISSYGPRHNESEQQKSSGSPNTRQPESPVSLEAVTAIATVFIAAFTIVLAVVTNRQAKLTRDALTLARDEFNATHRPKIIVRNFQSGVYDLVDLPDGRPVQPVFIAQNIGYSTGKIIEIRSGTIVLEHGEKLPSDLSFAFKETFDIKLAGGERELFPANGGSVPTDEELFDIFAGEKVLFCLGTITYLDGGGIIRRETGFCRRYVHKEKLWEAVESEYEYSY